MKLYTNITEQASFQELDQSFFVEDITKPYHLPRRTRIDRHREYKSVGFAFLFGKEKNFRDILLDLFDTKLPKHIFPVNTQGALGQAPFYHDVAFVDSDGQLFVLLEHQSTLDSYMAKRCFLYYVAYLSANLHKFPSLRCYTIKFRSNINNTFCESACNTLLQKLFLLPANSFLYIELTCNFPYKLFLSKTFKYMLISCPNPLAKPFLL